MSLETRIQRDQECGDGWGIGERERAHHISAKHEDWEGRNIGEALYQHTLMILRNRGNYSTGGKMNSRRRVGSECGIQMGDNGGRLGNDIDRPMGDISERRLLATRTSKSV